ncbi:MAG: alkaline phosphatase family protein, partial [Candidatus Baltobacteraceae bacterium]
QSPIQHVVIVVQENRSFNDFFATFPGTTGTTTGKMRVKGKTEPIALKKVALLSKSDLRHTYPAYHAAYRDGYMDGFNLIRSTVTGKTEGTAPYQYVDPNDVQPYWTMATQYAIADRMFQTQGSGSYTAHQDLIAGATIIDGTHSVVDDPTRMPWGCPAPSGTVTSLITTSLKYQKDAGPPPCFSYPTMQVLLDGASLSWKYYTPAWRGNTGGIWNAFLSISAVFKDQSEWSAHISQPETTIFDDVSGGTLPAVSWLIPDGMNSDHPAYPSDTGPSWVASVVNAIGQSKYWKSTAIVVVWDDWGGFYDPVKPPKLDEQGGPGFRVGMIVVSPYVPSNTISHTTYEFGSILRFVEDNWNLGRLGTTDQTTKSIANVFDFTQSPRKFQKIPSQYSKSYFLHRPPSGLPVDTE